MEPPPTNAVERRISRRCRIVRKDDPPEERECQNAGMSIFEPASLAWRDRVLAIFRIVAGLIFLTAGTMKLFGYPPSPVLIPPLVLLSQMGIGGVLEVVGGILIVLGLFTRPTAFILSGEMAVAYFQFHAPGSFWPTVNMGIPAIMYSFFFFYLVFAGAGAWSLDRIIARRAREGGRPSAAARPVGHSPASSG